MDWLDRIERAAKRQRNRKGGFYGTDRKLAKGWDTCLVGELGLSQPHMGDEAFWPGVAMFDAVLHDDIPLARSSYKKLMKIAAKEEKNA